MGVVVGGGVLLPACDGASGDLPIAVVDRLGLAWRSSPPAPPPAPQLLSHRAARAARAAAPVATGVSFDEGSLGVRGGDVEREAADGEEPLVVTGEEEGEMTTDRWAGRAGYGRTSGDAGPRAPLASSDAAAHAASMSREFRDVRPGVFVPERRTGIRLGVLGRCVAGANARGVFSSSAATEEAAAAAAAAAAATAVAAVAEAGGAHHGALDGVRGPAAKAPWWAAAAAAPASAAMAAAWEPSPSSAAAAARAASRRCRCSMTVGWPTTPAVSVRASRSI